MVFSYFKSLKNRGLVPADSPIIIGVLGDSTEAGVGAGGGVYGQTNASTVSGGQKEWAMELMKLKNFIPVSTNKLAGADGCYLARKQWDNSVNESFNIQTSIGVITIYYAVEGNTNAATVDISINGVQYTINSKLGTVSPDGTYASYNIRKLTVNNGQLSQDVEISNMRDGIRFSLIGFSDGYGVEYHDWSVSSSTLLNNSAANQSRSITTIERLSHLIDAGCNVISVGFGTNDSKDGVRSAGVTGVSEFKTDMYNLIIEPLRTINPNIKIILNTDPAGLSTLYENNVVYNEGIRELCLQYDLELIDVEALFDVHPEFYSDTVHPNRIGYNAIRDLYLQNIMT